MKIFLVDDSAPVRRRLRQMLHAIPGIHIVGEAPAAAQAVAGILAAKPDLVLLDIQLEKGSGFDVLRALHDRAPHTACYMLSNFVSEPYRNLAERLGATGFFDKTTEFERVRDAIAERARESAISTTH